MEEPKVKADESQDPDAVKKKVARMIEDMRAAGSLPALNDNIRAICEITGKSNTCAVDLASVILRDCGLTSNIIATANSSAYSPRTPIKTISVAVVFLGFERIRSLALGLAFFKQTMMSMKDRKLAFLYASSYFSGTFAQSLAKELNYANPEEIFVAGLLNRLPLLALANTYPDRYQLMETEALKDGSGEAIACEKIFGVKYESLCAALADVYRLPDKVAKALKGGPALANDPMAQLVKESGHLANMLFGNKLGGKTAMAETSDRIASLLRKQSFTVPDFIKKVCTDDHNISRFFKLDKSDVEMMVSALEWGKGNPAQIAAQLSAAAGGMDTFDKKPVAEDPEILIGHFLTELMMTQKRQCDLNQVMMLAQEAIYRCILRSEVFAAFLIKNRTTLVGRFYAGENSLVKASDITVPMSELRSPLVRCVQNSEFIEWHIAKDEPLQLPGLKRFMLIKSALLAPISALRQTIGLHFVARTDDTPFDDREKAWLEQIAFHVGLCIAKTQDAQKPPSSEPAAP